MADLDLTKTIDFEVLGDIEPTIIKHLGFYKADMTSDCAVHLAGTGAIELPAYWKYLTYRGWCDKDGDTVAKRIVTDLYEQGLIKVHEIRN